MTAPLAFTRHPVDDSIDAIDVCCAQGWTDGRRDEGESRRPGVRSPAKERGVADYPIVIGPHPTIMLTDDELHTPAEKALAEIVAVLTDR